MGQLKVARTTDEVRLLDTREMCRDDEGKRALEGGMGWRPNMTTEGVEHGRNELLFPSTPPRKKFTKKWKPNTGSNNDESLGLKRLLISTPPPPQSWRYVLPVPCTALMFLSFVPPSSLPPALPTANLLCGPSPLPPRPSRCPVLTPPHPALHPFVLSRQRWQMCSRSTLPSSRR